MVSNLTVALAEVGAGRWTAEGLEAKIKKIKQYKNDLKRSMVRNLAAALVEVGAGRWTADGLEAAVAARDRALVPVASAPAHGLTLERVLY